MLGAAMTYGRAMGSRLVTPAFLALLAQGGAGCSLFYDLNGLADRKPPDGAAEAADGPEDSDTLDSGAPFEASIRCGSATCATEREICCEESRLVCTSSDFKSDGGCRSSSWASCTSLAACAKNQVCCAVLFPSGSTYHAQCMTRAECENQSGSYRGVFACDPNEPVPCPPDGGTCGAANGGLVPFRCR